MVQRATRPTTKEPPEDLVMMANHGDAIGGAMGHGGDVDSHEGTIDGHESTTDCYRDVWEEDAVPRF
jgi:hypothetical protein